MSQHTVRGENMRPTEYANPCGCRYHLTRHPPIAFCSTHAAAVEMLDALKRIAKDAFNRDPLKHAENVIEEHKEIARVLLARIEEA